MKYLFCHRNFPAQFRHIIYELSKNKKNEIVFITGTKNNYELKSVKKYTYSLKRHIPKDCHRYLSYMEDFIIHGQAAAELAISLKHQGFKPDIIYSHSWGNSLFLKEVFPGTPQLSYCEWYFNPTGADIGFRGEKLNINDYAALKCKCAPLLMDLVYCDRGICPTNWQKMQFPKEFQNKIEVIHDGVDTEFFTPDKEAIFKVPDKDVVLSANDEVITYATRGMEPHRGFPEFIQIIDSLLKTRPNLNVIIAGQDRVCYGKKPAGTTYKKMMLEKYSLDMSRVHFTGLLPLNEYKKILQISSAHVYLTYPFVLSWSLLDAMSAGACVIASNTAPVQEVIENNANGYLVDFYDVDGFVSKINEVLDNKDKQENIRMNARKSIVEKYDLKEALKKQIAFLNSLV